MTPLHWAVLGDNLQAAACLLRNGAETDIRDTLDRTPLYYAIVRENEAMIDLLLKHGASQTLNATEYFYGEKIATTIHLAARQGNIALLRRLLADRGNGISSTPEPGVRTPLSWAAYKNHEDVVRLLLGTGACVNSRGLRGEVPLHCANTQTITRLLLQHGASVNLQTDDGQTPLHCAKHPDVIELLLHAGADANLQNSGGDTYLHLAVPWHNLEKVQQLLCYREADCDLEIENQARETALTYTIAQLGEMHEEQRRLKEDWANLQIIVVGQPNTQSWKELRLKAMAHLFVSRGADISQLPPIDPAVHTYLAPLYDELKQKTYLGRMLALQEYLHGLQETEGVPLDVSRIIAGMLRPPREVSRLFPT